MVGIACIFLINLNGIRLWKKTSHRFKAFMKDDRYSHYRLTAKGHDELIGAEQALFEAVEHNPGVENTEWHDWQSRRLKKRER